MSSRKRFSLKKVFFFIFIVSTGVNFYLLFFSGGKEVSASRILETSLGEGKAFAAPVAAKADPAAGKAESSSAKGGVHQEAGVKQASFAPKVNSAETKFHTLHLKIRNSLNYTVCRSLSRDQGCESLTAHLGRLMGWFFDIKKKMRNGDSLSVVYKEVAGDERFRVLKLRYQSGYYKKTFEANFFRGPDMRYGSYFDGDGLEITKRIADYQTPIKRYKEITSLPGDFRKGRNEHSGTDFKADVGTPIYSSFEGRITRINWNLRMNGYCVEIDHPRRGVKSLYLHLSRIFVRRGDFVRQGQKIAESGNTGRTFAPHLHFEIKNRDNKSIFYNPFRLKFVETYQRRIPNPHLEAYQRTLARYDSLLQTS